MCRRPPKTHFSRQRVNPHCPPPYTTPKESNFRVCLIYLTVTVRGGPRRHQLRLMNSLASAKYAAAPLDTGA